jgi:hypothetical protein
MQSNEKTSGTSMKSSIPSGQEEKKIFINSIKSLQAKVNGTQLISVTVIPPRNSKGKKKLSTKDSVGVDMNVHSPMASVSRKHVSEVLQVQGKYRKLITNEWIETQFVLMMEMNRILVVHLGRSRNLFAPREGWLSFILAVASDKKYA